MRLCEIEGCGKPWKARGWCGMHWWRWRKYGDPLHVTKVIGDDEARFWLKVEKTGSCWLWRGTLNERGYGKFALGGKHVKAHRYAYELLVGPIPAGHAVDHLCQVRNCVRPEHLEAVPQVTNIQRKAERATHCRRGHPWNEANTYVGPAQRSCRACIRESKERRAK